MFLRRSGGQSQFSSLLSVQSSARQPIEDLTAWMLDHLAGDLDVESLAARCGMSPRHFARVFAKEKGSTPACFVERLRVSTARALLQDSGMSVKEAAVQTGFGSSDSMRRAFSARAIGKPHAILASFLANPKPRKRHFNRGILRAQNVIFDFHQWLPRTPHMRLPSRWIQQPDIRHTHVEEVANAGFDARHPIFRRQNLDAQQRRTCQNFFPRIAQRHADIGNPKSRSADANADLGEHFDPLFGVFRQQ